MYDFGTIVLVPFPFTDLSSAKLRPALILSRDAQRSKDIVLCFITTKKPSKRNTSLFLAATKQNGLKQDSYVVFSKIATIQKNLLLGKLGFLSSHVLEENRATFFRVFGFKEGLQFPPDTCPERKRLRGKQDDFS